MQFSSILEQLQGYNLKSETNVNKFCIAADGFKLAVFAYTPMLVEGGINESSVSLPRKIAL